MDLDGWEILPRDGFIDYNHEEEEEEEEGERKNFSISSPRIVFKKNHFNYPSSPPPPPPRTGSPRLLPNQQPFPIEIQLEPKIGKDPEAELIKEVVNVSTDTSIVSSATTEKVKDSDLDEVAQVFFKKLKENKFADMKTYSPKASTRGVLPQVDAGAFNFDDRTETREIVSSPNKKVENDEDMREEVTWEENGSAGLNLWKWSLNGIGAICSFGVAAATFCVIILGSHQRDKQQQQKNLKVNFQIYTDDAKRIKQVLHHATNFNEAMSAVRGVPLNRAQITTGGYYDGF